MVWILWIGVTILLLCSILLFQRDVLCPSFLLTAGFWLALISCSINQKKWDITDLYWALVIFLGLTAWQIAAFLVYWTDRKTKKKPKPVTLTPIQNMKTKMRLFLVFQLFYVALLTWVIYRNTGLQGGLFTAIGRYYVLNKYGKLTFYLGPLTWLEILDVSGTFLLIYIAVNNFMCKASNSMLCYLNILISVIASLMHGTRTTMFRYVIETLVLVLIFYNMKKGWKGNISLGMILKLMAATILSIAVFYGVEYFQGRSEDVGAWDVIFTYIGSSLKNLELFIGEGKRNSGIFGAETMINTWQWLYELTGNEIFNIPSLYQYRWISGNLGLGNVYSIFMPLIYDFGFAGAVAMMAVLGMISQKLYDVVCFAGKHDIHLRSIVYAYSVFAFLMSFFSNKFFEMIIARGMLHFLVGLWLFDLFFFHLDLKRMVIHYKR